MLALILPWCDVTSGSLQAIDVNVGELQMYGNVNWLNALDELGKMKKNCDVITMLFVFRSGVLLLAWERPKGKRRQKGVS